MIKKNEVIKQSNALTTATYSLSRSSKRILYLSLKVLSDRDNLQYSCENEGYIVSINYLDYKKMFNDTDNVYREIRKAAYELKKGEILIYPNNDRSSKDVQARGWINAYDLLDKQSKIVLYFNKYVGDRIHFRDGDPYTKYLLFSASNLASPYAMRLYELICQWRNTRTSFKQEIDWMIETFGMSRSYKKLTHFRQNFLIKCVEQINEHTDIEITKYEEVFEQGNKKPSHIKFYWREEVSSSPVPIPANTLESAVLTHKRLQEDLALDLITKNDLECLKSEWGTLSLDGFDMLSIIDKYKDLLARLS